MTVLLDTHTFLWFVLNDAQLSSMARNIIEDPMNEVLVSPATYWEIAIKVSRKKLDLLVPYNDFMQRGIVGNDFEILHIDPKHTEVVTTLPFHHKDPFDRLLIAQARSEGIPLVSADALFDDYAVSRIW